MKKLLMLNASEHEIPFILAARSIGYYVITTSTKSEYCGHRYADEYIKCDYNDYDALVDLARQLKIDAISHACTDDCALAAAYVGEQLGLKGHDTYENACIIHRKNRFKEFAEKHNVLTPVSKAFDTIEDAMAYGGSVGFPVIVKPTDMAGGVGIGVANNVSEYTKAISCAFEKSHIKHIVVEPFIQGATHTLCTFLVDQKVAAYAIEDDHSFRNRYMSSWGVWNGLDGEKYAEVLIPETERIAGILGLVDGQLSMQYIVDQNGKPWIIEMMRRNIGNNNTLAIQICYGINWAEWVMRAESGMDCHNIPRRHAPYGYGVYYCAMSERNGIFDRIEISPEIRKYVYQIYDWSMSGHEITNYLMEKMGCVMMYFPTLEERLKYEDKMHEFIRVILK